MIDFGEIDDFEKFEDLCEEILSYKGLEVRRLGRGPGQLGKDIVAKESIVGTLYNQILKKWLVEVKFTKATRSLNENDVSNVSDRAQAQGATGYLLFTNAKLGVNLERTLNGLRQKGAIDIMIWGRNLIEKEVLKSPHIFRKFFPGSHRNWIKRNRIFVSNQVKLCKSPLTCTLASLHLIHGLLENPNHRKIVYDRISEATKLIRSLIDEMDKYCSDFPVD